MKKVYIYQRWNRSISSHAGQDLNNCMSIQGISFLSYLIESGYACMYAPQISKYALKPINVPFSFYCLINSNNTLFRRLSCHLEIIY